MCHTLSIQAPTADLLASNETNALDSFPRRLGLVGQQIAGKWSHKLAECDTESFAGRSHNANGRAVL